MARINVCVFTRGLDFDYTWITGHPDAEFLHKLEKFSTHKFSSGSINPNYASEAYFQFGDYLIYKIMRFSDDRNDMYSRNIYERLFAVWRSYERLDYGHLPIIREKLLAISRDIIGGIPQNLDYSDSLPSHEFIIDETNDRDLNIPKEMDWTLPFELSVKQLAEEPALFIEVPFEWSLDDIIKPLRKEVLSAQGQVSVGMKMPLKLCREVEGSWVFSNAVDKGSTVRVLSVKGDVIKTAKELQRHRSPTDVDTSGFAINELKKTEESRDAIAQRAKQVYDNSLVATKKPSLFGRIFGAGGDFPDNFHEIICSFISNLLAPRMDTIQNEHFYSWVYLLREISANCKTALPETRKEWLRRLNHLQEITAVENSNDKWNQMFQFSCKNLHALLQRPLSSR